MKHSLLIAVFCSMLIAGQPALAAEHPEGNISFHNSSSNQITAQVSAFGKVTLAAKETKDIAYSSLVQACSASPTSCKALFFVNNIPVGYAILNVVTGKVVSLVLSIKVSLNKGPRQVLRSVVIL